MTRRDRPSRNIPAHLKMQGPPFRLRALPLHGPSALAPAEPPGAGIRSGPGPGPARPRESLPLHSESESGGRQLSRFVGC